MSQIVLFVKRDKTELKAGNRRNESCVFVCTFLRSGVPDLNPGVSSGHITKKKNPEFGSELAAFARTRPRI